MEEKLKVFMSRQNSILVCKREKSGVKSNGISDRAYWRPPDEARSVIAIDEVEANVHDAVKR